MTTLADKAILSGADNLPSMLEKDMYDSCKSRMELYMMNRQHGRMILESVEKIYTPGASGSNSRKQRTVICYNCKGEGHMSKQYTKSKRKRDDSWFKDKVLLVQAQANGQILHEKELAILVDPRIAKDALAEVHNPNNVDTNMINQAVHAMPSSEQSNVVNHSETKITSDRNIILYSQYVIESQQAVVQISNFSAQQDARILSVIEQLKTQVVNCTKINLDNKSVNDTLTVELERYKEQVKVLKEGQNVALKSKDNVSDSCAQSNSMNSPEPTLSSRPTKVEVPKELFKVSMVNTSLKKLKHHLVGFDVVVKERTMNTAITEGLDNSVSNQSASSFDHYFELNELKAQSQEKDTVISKLKERIKSLSGNKNTDKVKKDIEQIETINIKLDHRVSKLIAENEHLKQTYKQIYDSIKPTRVRSKEQSDALINQVNQKFMEISDLNVSLQEKFLVITALKDDLRKLKGKDLVDDVVTSDSITPKMFKVDVEPLAPKLLNNRTVHSYYLRHTQEQATILREVFEQGKSQNPLNNSLDHALAVPPMNKAKRVRFIEPVTSSGNTNTKTASSSNLVSNNHALFSTGVNPSTSASGSQPLGNTKKDKIQRPSRTASVQHCKINANFELIYVKCNACMLFDNHDLCVLNDVNARAKSKSVKKNSKRKVWKPTGKVFNNIGYILRPTGRTFTMVGNACPLTKLITSTEMPSRNPIPLETGTPKPIITLIYSRKPRKYKSTDPVSKSKVIKSVSANKKEPNKSWGSTVSNVPSSSLDEYRLSKLFFGTVKFRNDHVAKIMGYGDYQIGNVTISRVYYVEGLGHNLFSVGQFCDSNLEVVFRQHTCYICNLNGVDLLTGSRGNNPYTLSLRDMMAKKKPHKPKSEDTNQEKLYLLDMDLCGPMRVASVNGKKYILVIVDDYSGFTWVDISHETSVARSPQQNGVDERRNRTLIKVARTMLFYAKASLFLWAEAVATACYTKNHSIIRLHHGKTPYELLHNKPPDLSFLHAFGALCYPTNDSENLGKLQAKADIGIFIGYAPTKKAFWIYNRRTRRIKETIHVDFDELTTMASEHSSSGPALYEMTLITICSVLVPNIPPLTPVDHPTPEVIAPIAEVVALEPVASTGSPSSTSVDQDAPSLLTLKQHPKLNLLSFLTMLKKTIMT
nr:hypothetical protein [Tanacetum cinerariifolium]